MTTEEIEEIFQSKIKLLKGLKTDIANIIPGNNKDKDKGDTHVKIPDLNPVYVKSVEYKRRIAVHSELDAKPLDLMHKRAPREDDEQFAYRERNYQPVTMPFFMKALAKLNRIFNPSNYSIQWKDDQDDQKKYFMEDIPVFKSLEKYFEEIVLTQKIVDPNSLIIIKPFYLPQRQETVTNERTGKPETIFVFDDTQPVSPVPSIVGCERVIDYREGLYALIELEEKSWVKGGDKKVKEGKIFEFYDRENIYRITQIGKKEDWKFTEPELYFPHNLGYLPCQKLKGIAKQHDLYTLYLSYFIFAIPNLDIALCEHMNLDISILTQMFPQRVEMVDKCDEPHCNGGFIYEVVNDIERRSYCKKCNGEGRISKLGPMSVKQFTIPDPMNGDDTMSKWPAPGVWYVAPDPSTLEFVYKKLQNDIWQAFGFINLDVSNSDVKGTETALGKQIDREELFSFLMRISSEIFSLLHFTIETIGKMRYGESFNTPLVSPPTSFSIRNEYDLTEELTEAQEANIPDIARREIIREYCQKRFSNNRDIEKIVNLVFVVDRFITSSPTDLISKLSAGIAAKWEAVLHDSIYSFIEEILLEDDKFFEKDFKDQKAALVEKAKALTTEIAPVSNTTDNILKIANAAA